MYDKINLQEATNLLTKNDVKYKHFDLLSVIVNSYSSASLLDRKIFLKEGALIAIAKAVSVNNTLEECSIDHVEGINLGVNWQTNGIINLIDSLSNHSKLKTISINLQRVLLNNEQIKELLGLLTGLAPIETLHLKLSKGIDGSIPNIVGQALMNNKTLKYVSIEGIDFIHYQEYSNPIMTQFAKAFSCKQLKKIKFKYLHLSEFALGAIANTLNDVHTLEEMIFDSCRMTSNGMLAIKSIFSSNPKIKKIDLSNNPLSEQGVLSFVSVLPNLLNLKILYLINTNLNAIALQALLSTCLKNNLKITQLKISNQKIEESDINAIKKFIDNNHYLRLFEIKSKASIEELIQKLYDVLSDPRRTKLKYFNFSINKSYSDEFQKILINILNQNMQLIQFARGNVALNHVCSHNEIKCRHYQNIFIHNVIELSGLYFLPIQKNTSAIHLSRIPFDVYLLILYQYGKDTPGMTDEDVMACTRLILENFRERRTLIQNGDYTPPSRTNKNFSALNNIHQWWSKKTRTPESREIFCTRRHSVTML